MKSPSNLQTIVLLGTALLVCSTAVASDKSRQQEQARLDKICYDTRQQLIAPQKKAVIAECVQEQKRTKAQKDPQAYCENFYRDYGERSGRKRAMYMDIPECQRAEEFQHSTRSTR